MLTVKQFYDLVERTRTVQQKYFESMRDPVILREAKALEAQVDKQIALFLKGQGALDFSVTDST